MVLNDKSPENFQDFYFCGYTRFLVVLKNNLVYKQDYFQ